MIQNLWSGKNKLYWLLTPLSLIYGIIVLFRRACYRYGLFKSWQAPVPVIIVGNLSVGGNGKTPLVITLVEALQYKGYHVGVVSRGYGGKADNYPFIVTEKSTANIAGDEPILIYQRTKIPLAVSPKRFEAIELLLKHHKIDVVITDDGLQHYALKRDIEIAVIDGNRLFGNGFLLPAGPLREPKCRLKQVDFIVLNGQIQKTIPHISAYTMTLEPNKAINLATGEKKPVTDLENVHAIAGIGDPHRFFSMLKALGVDVKNETAFADHQTFSLSQLNQITNSHQIVLMTEKDAVKCQSFAQSNWWYLPINGQIADEFILKICNKINKL